MSEINGQPDSGATNGLRPPEPEDESSSTMIKVVAAAVAVAALAIAAWMFFSDDSDTTATQPTTSTTPSASVPSAEPTPTQPPATSEFTVPVYFLQDTSAGIRLDREFHLVQATDAATGALTAMLSSRSQDPSSTSPWNPSSSVISVNESDGQIRVDLTGNAASGGSVGAEGAEMAVQQLVYTVTAALQASKPVLILLDGQPADLWGHVSTSDPITRADPLDVRKLVQINDPAFGATVGRNVTVNGEAAVFEATLPWRLMQDGAEVQSGFAMTAEGQTFAPFEFTLAALEPGEYTIIITEDDPSGGEGRAAMTDVHDFTVG